MTRSGDRNGGGSGAGDDDRTGESDRDSVRAAIDDIVEAREDVIASVVWFVRALREASVDVPADGVLVAAESLAEVGYDDRATVHAAMRASLLSRRADIDPFEGLFERFWRDLQSAGDRPVEEPSPGGGEDPPEDPPDDRREEPADPDDRAERDPDDGAGDENRGEIRTAGQTGDDDAGDDTVEIARYSPSGRSETVERTPGGDRYALADPVARLTRALATLPGRRRKRTNSGRFVDARRALRASFGTGGVVASLPESERADRDVRGTVLVDVSGSVLDSVDRGFLLEWLRFLAAEWRGLRVFFFDTELREVTDAFDERSVHDVSEALARAEAAWGGGTRIGDAFETVRGSHPDAVDHRTVVLVVSDGLERGEIDALERGATWLSRRARLFLWLNPLAASPAYEPTARGMAAALPAVDGLFAFSGADDVAEMARQLDRHDRTRLGYRYDPRLSDGFDRGRSPDRAGTRTETGTGTEG